MNANPKHSFVVSPQSTERKIFTVGCTNLHPKRRKFTVVLLFTAVDGDVDGIVIVAVGEQLHHHSMPRNVLSLSVDS